MCVFVCVEVRQTNILYGHTKFLNFTQTQYSDCSCCCCCCCV